MIFRGGPLESPRPPMRQFRTESQFMARHYYTLLAPWPQTNIDFQLQCSPDAPCRNCITAEVPFDANSFVVAHQCGIMPASPFVPSFRIAQNGPGVGHHCLSIRLRLTMFKDSDPAKIRSLPIVSSGRYGFEEPRGMTPAASEVG